MRFKVLTREQMFAVGWQESPSHGDTALRYSGPLGDVFWDTDSHARVAGTEVDIRHENPWNGATGAHRFEPVHGISISFKPSMLLAGRVRVDLPFGFACIPDDVISHWRGRWMPLSLTQVGDLEAPRLPGHSSGYFWTRGAFEPSPVVDLAFGVLGTGLADGGTSAAAPAAPDESPAPPPRPKPRPKTGLPEAALRFRDAPRVARLALITCGFELETQETEGHTWDGIVGEEQEYDEDEHMEAVSDRVAEILGDVPSHISSSLLSRVEDAIRESVEDELPASEYTRAADPREWMESNYSIPADIQVGADNSVGGFEFRTHGALSYMRFRRAAESIFRLAHQVDEGCSFHIHLAVKGVKHAYGERLQMALVEYLTRHISRVPESVRARWAVGNQYIKHLLSSVEKYSFIRFHPQGTWEFRCFGNIANARDAMTCLDLAVDAMQFAYKAVSGQASLLADSLRSTSTWADAVKRALHSSTPLDAVLAEAPFATEQVA